MFAMRVRTIQAKIIAVVLGAALITTVCAIVFVDQMRRNIETQITHDQASVAQTYGGLVDEYLAAAQAAARAIVSDPAVAAPLQLDAIQPELKGVPLDADTGRRAALARLRAVFPRLQILIVASGTGDLYMTDPVENQATFPVANIGTRDYFQAAMKAGKPAWSNVIVSAGNPIATLVSPVKDQQGNVKSVVLTNLVLSGLIDTAKLVNLGQDDSVLLLDSRGVPIVNPYGDAAPAGKPLTDLSVVSDALAGKTGSVAFYNSITERDELATIVPLKIAPWYVVVSQSKAAAFASFNKVLYTVVGLLVVGLVLIVGVGALVARSISRRVNAVAQAAAALAEGDVEQELTVSGHDEVGQMAESFRGSVAYLREMAAATQTVAGGDLTVEVAPRSERDLLGTAIASMVQNLRDVVSQVADGAGQIADSSSQLGKVTGETGAAVQEVSDTIQGLAASAQETSTSANTSLDAVQQLSQAVDSIARGASDQARQVQGATTTASEMAADVERVAANANQVSEASQQTKASAELGASAVRETVASMSEIQQVVSEAAGRIEELGKLGEKIGAVVETIDDIAEQTNLLALNAAIEAARAGEHGRGFAVVADEVRKLAERSQRETKAIAVLIRDVQDSTRQVVDSMEIGSAKVKDGYARADQAGTALAEILTAVDATVTQVAGIAAAAQQMEAGAHSVVAAMESISAVVEENTASTEEMAAQAGQVTVTIETIASVAAENSGATEQVSVSAQAMNDQIGRIAEEAEQLASTSDTLRSLVARFRLETAASDEAPVARRRAGDWPPAPTPKAQRRAS